MSPAVTIVGAGPAGLSAARVLRDAGVETLVLERNPEAGGLPRFAGHLGWGMLDFHRMWSGPTYAARLVAACRGVDIRVNHSVVALHEGGVLDVNGPQGTRRIESKFVLLTTGVRETPRSARLISGSRPWGVVSVGAFQEMVYRGAMRPFRRPVVLGSELVSFSALMTARHAGVRPAAMIEPGERIKARRPADWFARLVYGVPVHTRTRLARIEGEGRVSAAVVERDGVERRIACDGVIVSGDFTPEAALLRPSHLAVDPATGGPSIDNAWRCSDAAYFAAGNLLRPVEHSGFAALEGRAAAASILAALRGELPAAQGSIAVRAGEGLRYVYPQRLIAGSGPTTLYARAQRRVQGRLAATAHGREVGARSVSALPERRLTLSLDAEATRTPDEVLVTLG